MKIENFLENKIKQEVDTNIGCFGLTFFENGNCEYKCYRNIKKKVNNNIMNTFYSQNERFKRCDYKVSSEICYDLVKINSFIKNEMKYNGDLSTLRELLKISKKYYNKFRLMEIGTRSDFSLIRCDLRGYFSLRKFEKNADIEGKINSYKNIIDLMKELYDFFGVSSQCIKFIEDKSLLLEDSSYYPTLFGFQQSNGKIEKKLYFELCNPDRHLETLLEDNLFLVNYMAPNYFRNVYEEIIESILVFWKYNYFLRGIAYGLLDDKKLFNIRFYFANVEHFID